MQRVTGRNKDHYEKWEETTCLYSYTVNFKLRLENSLYRLLNRL